MKKVGPRSMNIELLKYGGFLLELSILRLLNECWKQRNTPNEWKMAEVLLLYKKGNGNSCGYYRGISILNCENT